MSFHGRGHDPLQLVDHVEDAVAGDLIAKLLLLVQGQFQPYSGGVRGVAASHAVVLYHVLRVVFLLMGIVPFSYSRDVHAEDLRNSLHNELVLVGTACLTFEHPPGANDLVSDGD